MYFISIFSFAVEYSRKSRRKRADDACGVVGEATWRSVEQLAQQRQGATARAYAAPPDHTQRAAYYTGHLFLTIN